MLSVSVERIIKADRDAVFGIAVDYENFERMVPEHFESVKIRSRRGNVAVVEEHVRLSGKNFVMMTKHVVVPPRIHEVFVIGGDAKGSHIVERYEQVREGTKLTVDAKIKLGGVMRVAGFLAKRRLARDMASILDGFARAVER